MLLGSNKLSGSGLQVPESARLMLEGEGSISIDLNAVESYGIGNLHTAKHGELIFAQDGSVNIRSRGKKCIGIGSGLGGPIRMDRGEFNLSFHTETCVGIGALRGDVSLELLNCHIEAELSVISGVAVGSLEGDVSVRLKSSAVNLYADGKYLCGIGSLYGKTVSVSIREAGTDFNLSADYSSCFGALYGKSELTVSYTSLKLANSGQEALIFGGNNEDTAIRITNSDTQVGLRCAIGRETFAPPEKITFVNGRVRILLNGTEIERPLEYDYS